MIITKVQLKNITTHKNNTIQFQDGINVLMGSNGTGKSTVLTMIGYVLFDYLPGKNQKSYVRIAPSSAKFGTIKVWIKGKDDQKYCIERTIGKAANKISVSHSDTGKILRKIGNKEHLREWLQDQMNLSVEFSLSAIFENAIGVKQGTFTAPFLMAASQRSKIFAPLLNVHIYSKIFSKYIGINHAFTDEIHLLEKEISRLEGEIEQKTDLNNQKTKLDNDLENSEKKITKIINKFTEIQKEYKELNEIKQKLEETTKIYEKLEIENKNLKKNIENVNDEIKEATEAEKICKKTKEDYSKYTRFLKEERKLQKDNKIFLENQAELNKLKLSYGKLKTESDQNERQIKDINKKSGTLPGLEEKFQQFQNLQKKIEEQTTILGTISNAQKNLANLTQDYDDLIGKIKDLQEDLKDISVLEEKCAQLEPLNQKISELNQSIAVKKAEIEQLQQNKKDSKGGKCPFLHEKCKNIEGDSLEDFFQKNIDEFQIKLNESQKKMLKLNKQLKKLKENSKKLENLRDSRIILEGFEKQSKKITKNIENEKKSIINKKQVEEDKKKFQQELNSLENDVKQYHIIQEKITKDLPRLNQEKSEIEEKISQLLKKIKPIEIIIKELEEIPDLLEEIQKKMESKIENYNKYQSNVKSMEKLAKYKQDLKDLDNNLQKIENKLIIKQKEKLKLEKQFDNEYFLRLEKQRETLNEESIKLKKEIDLKTKQLLEIVKKLSKLSKKEKLLHQKMKNWEELKNISQFSEKIRNWFKEAGPKITEALMSRINQTASELFRIITGEEAIQLEWQNDYDVHIRTAQNPCRIFAQLSGGEQMTAALAVRLAVLKVLTKLDFAFFDEPTTNLDSEKRVNLSKCIQNVRGFKQLFVISHDDTFEESANNVIRFSKNEYDESIVEFLK